jgi:phytoene synthase
MSSPAAQDPVAACADEVRRHDNDRYLTALFAPTQGRARLFALYAFNLELARVRESVSEPILGAVRLRFWRDAVAELHAGTPPRHPVTLALAATGAAARLDRTRLEALVDAREADLKADPPADLAALAAYAGATGGAVAALALDLLGVDGEASRTAAYDVGTAFALAGLLRAVPFHAAARRLYLPADRVAAAGIDRAALFAGNSGGDIGSIVREIAQAAWRRLDRAAQAHRDIPRAALPALLPAVLARRDLTRLERAGFDPFALAPPISPLGRQVALLLFAGVGRY